MKKVIYVFLLIFSFIASGIAFGPEEEKKSINKIEIEEFPTLVSGSPLNIIFYGPVRFYQKYLSKMRVAHCPSYPSCSRFAIASFKKYGFFFGLLMTVDRMFYRENSSMYSYYPYIKVNGGYRFNDPPEANWLFSREQDLLKRWKENQPE